MDKETYKECRAEYRSYEACFTGVTGKSMSVRPVPEGDDAVGYTSPAIGIYVAFKHAVMKGLHKTARHMFRMGVFVHEMLHQVFTDFQEGNNVCRGITNPYERQIAAMLQNVLEDPAIEYMAPTVIGGIWLKALRFSIAHIYKGSPGIDVSNDPFTQFFNALINFGDMGLVKGHFTSEAAKKCFVSAAPIFDAGIKEPNGKKRIAIAMEIFEMSRPLWEQTVKDQEAMDKLRGLLEELGKSAMSGKGHGQDGNPSALPPEETKKSKRRKITIKHVSKEEFDAMQEGAQAGEIPQDGDITLIVCDDAESSKEKSKEKGLSIGVNKTKDNTDDTDNADDSDKSDAKADADSSDKEDESQTDASKTNGGTDKTDSPRSDDTKSDDTKTDKSDVKADNDEKSDDAQDENADSSCDNPFRASKSSQKKPKSVDTGASDETEDENDTIDEEEYQISDDDIRAIEREQENAEAALEAEDENDASDTSTVSDFDISSPKMSKRTCLNYRVQCDEHAETLMKNYQTVLSAYAMSIKSTSNQLRKIFANDTEEREYRTSGKANMERIYGSRVTSRVFEKRRQPADIDDLVIMLVIDESGSMSYMSKDRAARESAIALAEICGGLHIPLYVMGFTADTQGYGVVHNHYITWKNSKMDRIKLMNITARANNADGYSIRYATEVLKRKHAAHKLMIVISDGKPAANCYSNGVSDTKDAIREAKREATVLGVAVGDSDTDVIYSMYENDFLHISNVTELFSGLAKKIKKMVRGWE